MRSELEDASRNEDSRLYSPRWFSKVDRAIRSAAADQGGVRRQVSLCSHKLGYGRIADFLSLWKCLVDGVREINDRVANISSRHAEPARRSRSTVDRIRFFLHHPRPSSGRARWLRRLSVNRTLQPRAAAHRPLCLCSSASVLAPTDGECQSKSTKHKGAYARPACQSASADRPSGSHGQVPRRHEVFA